MRSLMASMVAIVVIASGLAMAGPAELAVGAGITAVAAAALVVGGLRAHAAAALDVLRRATMVQGLD